MEINSEHIEIKYIPKGGMCAVCSKNKNDCSKLDFSAMKKIGKKDKNGLIVVRCINFNKKQNS